MQQLLSCLPVPPHFRWDWDGLMQTQLAPLFERMHKTLQNPAWHGEGDVWTHTRMVCEALCTLADFRALPDAQRTALALAALLHDAGKPACTRLEDGVLVSPHHGAEGAALTRKLLWEGFDLAGTPQKQQLREAVCFLIRYHTLPLHLSDNADPALRARRTAANGQLCPLFSLHLLCLLARADVLGRIASDTQEKLLEIDLSREIAEEAGCLHAPYAFASPVTAHACLSGKSVWPDQMLHDDTWGEVILMCGLPGTGKDTWLREHFAALPSVCLDDIRRELGVKPTDRQGRVVQAAQEKAREFLRSKQPFVWNATSLTPMLRRKEIQLFEEYGARVRIVYLETPWAENMRRNSGRSAKVPESVIASMLGRIIPPERQEARNVEWLCI